MNQNGFREGFLVLLCSMLASCASMDQNVTARVAEKGLSSEGSIALTVIPVRLPRTSQYDFTSEINGSTYRIMVGLPPNHDSQKAYPVLYVLEGNVYFATALDAMTRQALFRNISPAIVVGIGYPTDDTTVVNTRRWLDLSPAKSRDPNEKRATGGGDDFLRVIEGEIKPLVASRFNVESANQTLWGHSLGGLLVLRSMFTRPGSFSTYLSSSPSIWWADNHLLKDEVEFTKRVLEPGPQMRLLLTSAGEEQYRGGDAKLLAAAQRTRMIDNASELAARLLRAGARRLILQRYVLEGETHISVSHSALTRSLRFALPYKQPE